MRIKVFDCSSSSISVFDIPGPALGTSGGVTYKAINRSYCSTNLDGVFSPLSIRFPVQSLLRRMHIVNRFLCLAAIYHG